MKFAANKIISGCENLFYHNLRRNLAELCNFYLYYYYRHNEDLMAFSSELLELYIKKVLRLAVHSHGIRSADSDYPTRRQR